MSERKLWWAVTLKSKIGGMDFTTFIPPSTMIELIDVFWLAGCNVDEAEGLLRKCFCGGATRVDGKAYYGELDKLLDEIRSRGSSLRECSPQEEREQHEENWQRVNPNACPGDDEDGGEV